MRDLIEAYTWRDQKGQHHRPEDMSTSHLFNTLKMIWNHSVPAERQVKPFRQYPFGPFYSQEYINESVKMLMRELVNRTDLDHLQEAVMQLISVRIENMLQEEIGNARFKS